MAEYQGVRTKFPNYTVVVHKSFNISVSHSFYLQKGGTAPGPNPTKLVPLGKKEFEEQTFQSGDIW